ncbi:MAG: pyridoxal 5'-phosphate synthase glutaminase subunit PdxT [Desulfobacteraceae bacterium]
MRVGLLGLQGAFLDHIPHFDRLGVEYGIVRDRQELSRIDRLVIPGGESTVMTKFLKEYEMVTPLKSRIDEGMPVWGVCAGAILLAETIDGHPGPIGALPVDVTRNAYGRQINSSQRWIEIPLFDTPSYPAIFIRAPRLDRWATNVSVHAVLGDDPVFVQAGRIMATTFHPELNKDDQFHRYFLSL